MNYSIKLYNLEFKSTPSLVQVHMTQGEMRSAFPTSMLVDPTVHETRSFQSSKSMDGRERHGTRGFLHFISK